MSGNIIVVLIIAVIVIAAITKIITDKKNGVKCSGCPYAKACSGKSTCSSQSLPGSSENIENKQELRTDKKVD